MILTLLLALSPMLSAQGADAIMEPRGAHRMPYVRYEADAGELGGGARICGPSFDQDRTESEASGRAHVALPAKGAYVEWSIRQAVNGVNLRFTMPDSPDGTGRSGELEIFVNGKPQRRLPLSSYHAWQYFDKTKNPRHPANDPVHAKGLGSARMRFDEVHFRLARRLQANDRIRLQKTADDGIEYGIDFIEVEAIPPAIPKPEGFLDVTAFGAVAQAGKDDYPAFASALVACAEQGKGLYIPPGRYELGGQIKLDHDGLRLLGAGIWHTELYFTQLDKAKGGIYGTGSRLRVADLYLSSRLNMRRSYRAFGQHWGKGSTIENVWLDHFSTGFWVGHYGTKEPGVADGLVIRNCRIRNTYADGVNFAKGSRNCVLEHSNVRNNMDDGTATWASNAQPVGATENNTFRFNTVEHTLRASGIGIFGGKGHTVHHCLIVDSFAGPGVRLNSVFPGYPFADSGFTTIRDTTILRCGTRAHMWDRPLGAIDLEVKRYDVRNILFENVDVVDSLASAIAIHALRNKPEFQIQDVYFQNVRVKGTGSDGLGLGYGLLADRDVKGWAQKHGLEFPKAGDTPIANQAEAFLLRDGPPPEQPRAPEGRED
jgi:hypothetical protein